MLQSMDTSVAAISLCRNRPFATHGPGRLQARSAVCRIPCLILCLADVKHWCQAPQRLRYPVKCDIQYKYISSIA